MIVSRGYHEIRSDIDDGIVSCRDIVESHLAIIEELNPKINAFLEVYSHEAINRAELIDQKINEKRAGRLAGMVIGIKDILCYKEHHSFAGSKILKGFKSTFTATAIQRLLDEDAIIIGRQNCDEFGMGSTNENSAFNPTLNPANLKKVPGGSSGGSAAAVVSGMCQVSIGTDTGGSIRMPAAFCGTSGLKPTYGAVSRWGLIAYASSFDTIGPIANHIEDIELVFDIMKGEDEFDSTCKPQKSSFNSNKKIAYFKEIVDHDSLNPEIRESFKNKIEQLVSLGYQVEPVAFPYLEQLLPTYYILTTAEASSNLARFDGVKYGYRSNQNDLMDQYKWTRYEGFGNEVKRRILLGTFVLSANYYDAYYTKAQKVRGLIRKFTEDLFNIYDFIISPTTSTTAYPLGEKSLDPIQMYLGDLFTVQANVTGYPAMSIPAGFDKEKMPIGFQIMGNQFSELEITKLSKEIV